MFEVDRVAAVIRPTAAMLEWINQQPSSHDNVSLKNLQKDCAVILIPAFEGPRQSMEYVKQIYAGIFEAELISWGIPEKSWPKERSLELFAQWFKVEFHSTIYDIAFAHEISS